MNKPLHKYYFAVTLVFALLANLFLPAAVGAAQIICGDMAPVHANSMHASANCITDKDLSVNHDQFEHDDCSLGQICEQAVDNNREKSTILNIQRENLLATLPVQQLSQNLLFNNVAGDLSPSTSFDTPVRDIHILNSTFLN